MRPDEPDIIRRVLAGDHAAYAELVDSYRDAVCGLAYHHLGNFDDAQDAAQEAFVHAYAHLDQLRDHSRFGPWLRRIAANACATRLRRASETEVSLEGVIEERLASGESADREAVRIVVRQALGRLSDATRLTVTLAYINGYSHSEVAQFLEVPVNTVRSRLRHAKQRLREEMIGMVSDVLHEEKPGDELTVKVMTEATKRGVKAMVEHSTGDAIEHYDKALATLEDLRKKLEPEELKKQVLAEAKATKDRQRLAHLSTIPAERIAEIVAAELLCMKAGAVRYPLGVKAAIELREQAIETIVELGPPEWAASCLVGIGVDYSNSGNREKAEGYYQRALEAYKRMDDADGQANCLLWLGTGAYKRMDDGDGQANCLLWLGTGALWANEFTKGKEYVEQALPLFERKPDHAWVAVCRALLNMLDEVGEERYPSLLRKGGVCETLRVGKDGIYQAGQPGWSGGGGFPEAPALDVRSIIWQLIGPRNLVLPSGPVGTRRSSNVFSYTKAPLRSTLRVVSDSETVTVPAGTFERCRLIEMTRRETAEADEETQQRSDLNQQFLCGTRRAWFAPGVGMVQLWVKTGTDVEALIQLREFEIVEPSTDYLPLAIGNRWVYGWANVPEEYVGKEAYRVSANDGDLWFLEHLDYVYKQ